MLGSMGQDGYEVTDNADEADTVIVNTCGSLKIPKRVDSKNFGNGRKKKWNIKKTSGRRVFDSKV